MAFATTLRENKQSFIQAELTLGQPNDKYEQEADAVADQIMKMPSNQGRGIQRKYADYEEEEFPMKPLSSSITPTVQKQSNDASSIAPPHITKSLSKGKGSGHTMPEATQSFMSKGLGADFSRVKIHTDNNAVQMNRRLGARAFTHGTDIYFDEGKYSPQGIMGKRLLAHELTHVVQQSKGNLSIQGDWREDGGKYYEDAVKQYEEVKKKGSEAMKEAERKGDELYRDGKEFYNRALGYGERKLGEAEEMYEEGSKKAGELAEDAPEDLSAWWHSGSGEVTKIEFNGRRVQVFGTKPFSALAISGLMPGHPKIAEANLPSNTDCTKPEYQHIPDVGPIPAGSYYVNPAEAESNPPANFPTGGWGKYRTRLHEKTATYIKRRATTEREGGFFIHEDANKNGTSGCIGFMNNRDNLEVYERIKNNSAQIPVEVKYTAPVMAPGTGPTEDADQQ